jgi:hypothetical protein
MKKLALSHFISLNDTEFTDCLNYSGWLIMHFVRSLTELYHNSLHVSSVYIVHNNILYVYPDTAVFFLIVDSFFTA